MPGLFWNWIISPRQKCLIFRLNQILGPWYSNETDSFRHSEWGHASLAVRKHVDRCARAQKKTRCSSTCEFLISITKESRSQWHAHRYLKPSSLEIFFKKQALVYIICIFLWYKHYIILPWFISGHLSNITECGVGKRGTHQLSSARASSSPLLGYPTLLAGLFIEQKTFAHPFYLGKKTFFWLSSHPRYVLSPPASSYLC